MQKVFKNFTISINNNFGKVAAVIPSYRSEVYGITETVIKTTFLKKAKLIDISLVLCDDKFIQNLNNIYRGKNKPTNVLSFPQYKDINSKNISYISREGVVTLGDIVISIDTILRESKELGRKRLHHLLHLYVHGLLHLIGYDHILVEDAEIMEKLETKILGTIGIVPYEVIKD